MNISRRLVLLSAVVLAGARAEAQVYNLHLVTDNQPDYTDMKSFVESSTGAWDEPEEKAIAVWRWGRRSRRQLSCSREGTRYIADPILNFNSYGALNCGIISALNIGSWLELGYQARYVQLGDHTVSEVSWDGGRSWHMFDSSMSVFCYNHAGQVASCEEIKQAHGCELSGGKEEPGHYYLYHPAPQCASHLGPTGWRSASDNPVELNRTPLEGKGMGLSEFQVFDKAEVVPWPAEIRLPAVQVGPTGQREAEEGLFDRYLFSADGKYLLSCGPRGLAALWAAEDGAFVRIVRRDGECRFDGSNDLPRLVRAVDISPNGESLVAARGMPSEPRLSLEETETGKRIHVFPVRPKTVFPWICFSDDGRYLIGSGSWVIGEPAGWTKPPLEIWDTRTGRRVWDPDQPPPYTDGELEKARQALPEDLGKSGRLTPERALDDLKLLLLLRKFRDDGRPLVARGTLRGHGLSFFTPDGSRLITRDSIMPYTEYSSEAVFWDIGRSALLYEMEEDDELPEPFLFSADGRHFLRKAWEKSRGLYETASGRRRGTFDDLPATGAEAITADGRLALLTAQQQAILFDIPAGKSLQDYSIEGNSSYRAVFSPRGDRLLLGFKEDTEVHETRPPFRRLFRLEHAGAHRGRSNHAAFSPDGRRIVCADALWNAETGGRLRQFRVNAGLVFSEY
ncbi:MAG: WD40 repeat domain-containing protein [Thermoguttaceae bacterium]|jgi:WD40 repeat protein|nr:WD40 repeat domain-containing protein [Thermoguttaceae bacterium]MDI9444546.1 WD40 repeat domain-containing protein [Planctomycetota bacterium]